MASENVNSLRKSILLLYHARRLPSNGSNSVQAPVLQPQFRVRQQPPQLLRMPFTPSNPSRPRNSFTTGLRWLTAL